MTIITPPSPAPSPDEKRRRGSSNKLTKKPGPAGLADSTLIAPALEQRAVIRFLNAEGIQTSQICQRMKIIYGESCLSQKTFINGLTSSKMDELHVPILSDLDDQVLQRRQAR
ncbi:hypothetical protein LAZ67_11000253 [Cordylochernes scorpioides]|uniref:Mos1 transposase HTH domain-containing protein n=1 Tax=Cordylochernes scorpioides TaxID=51811 RepID=A0ABY6KXR7_9ARAC|nr:hypothetical protein LAZ67_11000253 [Cordylochernes scorpioides]